MRQLAARWLLPALLALALWAAPGSALAAANHPFLGTVGSAHYEDACGLAFGPGGLYVSNYGADAIEGPTTITGEAPQGGPCKLAFDPAGDLYVNNWGRNVVRYEAGNLTSGAYEVIDPEPASAAEAPTGLAVDPITGDLYVAHRTFIAKYANPPHEGELPTVIGANAGAAYYGIAYSNFPATQGDLYVPDAATGTVKAFDSSTGTELEEVTGEAGPQGSFRDLLDSEAFVDNNPTSASYGHLYVLDDLGIDAAGAAEGALDEFDSEGNWRGQIKGFVDAGPSGIAIEAATGNVLVTSGGTEGSAVFKYGPTAPARVLKVEKTGTGGGEVRSKPAGIACGAACAAEFNEGEKVELFAAPDAHSVFKGWSGGGCVGAGSCTVLMTAALEIDAEFEEPTQQTLAISVTGAGTVTSEPAGLSCSGSCSEHFAQGRLVTLAATPAADSRFKEWVGLPCDESTQPTCQVTMSGSKTLEARFEAIPPLPLSVTVSGSGAGTVTSEPAGVSCPGTCAADFGEGSQVTLIASAAPGSDFTGWSGACTGAAATCIVTMAAAQTVGAEFDLQPPGAPPGTVGSIPCESDECAPLPVAPEDPSVGTLAPGGSNPPVHFPPRECPAGKRRVRHKGKIACVPLKHHRHKHKHHHRKGKHR